MTRRNWRDQNDHCILTFMGHQWRIVRMRGSDNIRLRGVDFPSMMTTLDLSEADVGSYAVTANRWLQNMEEAEVVT